MNKKETEIEYKKIIPEYMLPEGMTVEYLTAEEILKKYPRRMINPKIYSKLKKLTKERKK